MTNYERIKAMSVEEMARMLMCPAEYDLNFNRTADCHADMSRNCNECTRNWLNSEAQDDTSSVTADAVPPSPQGEGLTSGQKDALLRTFLGRGGDGA